jgi:hypothetical protein
LDGSTTITVPVSDNLLVIPNTGAQTTITITGIQNVQKLVGNFITPVGLLTTTVVVGGFWNTFLYSNSTGGGGNTVFWTVINEVNASGTFIKNLATGIYSSGTVVQTTSSIYEYSLYVPLNTLTDLNSRIQLQIYTQASSGNHNLTIRMRDSTLSYLVTTIATNLIGSTGPTGQQGSTGLFNQNYTIYPSVITSNTGQMGIGLYDFYRINTQTNPIIFTLQSINTLPNNRGIYTITDVGGFLSTNNLTITSSNSDSIANSTSIILNSNYSSLTLVADYVNQNRWFIN